MNIKKMFCEKEASDVKDCLPSKYMWLETHGLQFHFWLI